MRLHVPTPLRWGDLDAYGVRYTIVPTLVRGLDYYTHTAFEFVTTALGAQGAVMAGGRYDFVAPLETSQRPFQFPATIVSHAGASHATSTSWCSSSSWSPISVEP